MFLYIKYHYYNDAVFNTVKTLKIEFTNSILKIKFK